MATEPLTSSAKSPDPDEYLSLPSWLYRDEEFFAHETERVFRPSWQIVCHVNDIPQGRRLSHVRFHRGVACRSARRRSDRAGIPQRLPASRSAPRRRAVGALQFPADLSLPWLELRSEGQPFRRPLPRHLHRSRHRHARAETGRDGDLSWLHFRPTGCRRTVGRGDDASLWGGNLSLPHGGNDAARSRYAPSRAVNWKNIADNYSDALHINVAHPGLTRLFGKDYRIDAGEWVHKMWGRLRDEPSSNRSERMYQHYLPPVPHLPAERQRLWTYFKLWPNVAFDIYPDQIDFMQFVPFQRRAQ